MNRYALAIGRALDGLDLAGRGLGALLDLGIRWWLASIFFVSGVLKAANWQTALELARSEYPVGWMDPVTAAWLGAGIELICPVFLLVGLFTRLAAVPMLALSLVIQFSYRELPDHLFWAILLGWIVVRGPGAVSIDHLLAPALRRTALPVIEPVMSGVDALTRFGGPLYLLFVRVWLAGLFWDTGLAVAPLLLAAGLGTRLTGLALLLPAVNLDGADVYWLMLLGQIVLRGPGILSLDFGIVALLRRLRPADPAEPPRVVIVGAGFGGLAAARALRFTPAQVTVIDRRNHHLFQPLLYQVATAALSPADIAVPIRAVLRDQANTQVLLGRVTSADPERRVVRMESEGEAPREIPYDYLVLATGARHSYFGKDAWESDAPGLKKLDDATAIRRRVLLAFERAEACADDAERRRLLTFVIVGAGPTGVELAGAIAELARFGLAQEFRHFDPASARVILVQSGPRVLPVFPEHLSANAMHSLEKLGVEVRLNGKVVEVDDRGVTIGNERIHCGTVLWAAGVIASGAAKWIGAPADRAGRVKVGTDLSIDGRPDVFAIGDTAMARDAAGEPLPGLAPVAKQEGAYVARVIHARITGGRAPKPFRYRHLGSMATIGRKAAIADFGWLRLSGVPAWWLWGAVHVALLVGVRNRLAVMLDWLWAYLTYRRNIRLITGAGHG